jgi:hypothetical protein
MRTESRRSRAPLSHAARRGAADRHYLAVVVHEARRIASQLRAPVIPRALDARASTVVATANRRPAEASR